MIISILVRHQEAKVMWIFLLALLFSLLPSVLKGGHLLCTLVHLAWRIDASDCYTALPCPKEQNCSILSLQVSCSICHRLKLRSSWSIQITWLRGIPSKTRRVSQVPYRDGHTRPFRQIRFGTPVYILSPEGTILLANLEICAHNPWW